MAHVGFRDGVRCGRSHLGLCRIGLFSGVMGRMTNTARRPHSRMRRIVSLMTNTARRPHSRMRRIAGLVGGTLVS